MIIKILKLLLLILTFVAESCFVLCEPLESDPLSEQVKKLVEGRASVLIVVHLLLALLPRPAVHNANLGIIVMLINGRL